SAPSALFDFSAISASRHKQSEICLSSLIRGDPRRSVAKNLAEVRAAKLLPEISPVQRNNPAHLMQPGAHALADPVAERFSAARGPRSRHRAGSSGRRLV